jgi:8-oxo-dGTP pyrophosphatase MutT (NUDIX family)
MDGAYTALDQLEDPLEPNGAFVITRDQHGRYVVLLGTRKKWMLPGGGIKPFELPRFAAVRETNNESGLHLDATSLVQIGLFAQTIVIVKDGRKIIVPISALVHLFNAPSYEGEFKKHPDKEVVERRFMTIEDIIEIHETEGTVRLGDLRMILYHDALTLGTIQGPVEGLLRDPVRFRDTDRYF